MQHRKYNVSDIILSEKGYIGLVDPHYLQIFLLANWPPSEMYL